MVGFLHIKIVLLDGCGIFTLIIMNPRLGCTESCLMHDSEFLIQGVSQGISEADLLHLASFMWICFFSV